MQASRYFEPFLSTCYVLSKRFSMPITKVLTELKWDAEVYYRTQETN
jgi:hypothetical protein